MASIYNSQRVLGVRLQAEGATMHNFQRTIGIVPVADAVTFSGNDQTLGVAMLGADQAIYNDQPVIGGVLISDGRTMYNDQPVVPVSVRSGAMFDFLAGSATGGSQAFTRSSAGWRFDDTGALASTATDVMRVDYDPSTLAKLGALLETASTNHIGNNSGTGAVAGTPGTLPDTWLHYTAAVGTVLSVVSSGTSGGVPYGAIRLAGTAVGLESHFIYFDYPIDIVAAEGETWTASLIHQLAAGSVAGTAIYLCPVGCTAAGAAVDTQYLQITPTTAGMNLGTRAFIARTLVGGTIARITSFLQINIADGTVLDCTLRLSPQLEKNATGSTPILTTAGVVTRAADVLTLTPADAGALTWHVRYDDNSEATLATGVTGDYVVDPATLARPRVKAIWATP